MPSEAERFTERVIAYVLSQKGRAPGVFLAGEDGLVSLSASAYAALTLHYLGALTARTTEAERAAWADAINAWQDEQSGLYFGPELVESQLTEPKQDMTYLASHLTMYVLAALDVLGAAPRYPLTYARQFADVATLSQWLDAINLRDAWYEGNRLLIAGALLTWLIEREGQADARRALDCLFEWLDAHQDPRTGLWGTNASCDAPTALYGTAHQLVLYFYHDRPLNHADRIVDTALSLQHPDGGFVPDGGGGACEDIDAIDVLVKCAGRSLYRRSNIEQALRKGLAAILDKQMPDGGFVYRHGTPYVHAGMVANWAGPGQSLLFSTWYRVLTIGLISQVVRDQPYAEIAWQFNRFCAQGWHRRDETLASVAEVRPVVPFTATMAQRGSLPGRLVRSALGRVPPSLVEKMLNRYAWALPPEGALRFLARAERQTAGLLSQRTYEYGSGLHPAYWHTQYGRAVADWFAAGETILHLGAGDGSVSLALMALLGAPVIAVAGEQDAAAARLRAGGLRVLGMDDRWEETCATAALVTVPEPRNVLPRFEAFLRQGRPGRVVWLDPASDDGEWSALERQLAGAVPAPSAQLLAFMYGNGYRCTEQRLRWGQAWLRFARTD